MIMQHQAFSAVSQNRSVSDRSWEGKGVCLCVGGWGVGRVEAGEGGRKDWGGVRWVTVWVLVFQHLVQGLVH